MRGDLMALSLAELLAPKTTAQMRQQLLDGLQGRGVVTKTGTGTGSLSVSGVPLASYAIQILISTSGEPGAGQFQYSTDGGTTFSGAATIPSTPVAIGSTGVSVTFAAGPAGAGVSFIAGDLFAFAASVPTFPATSWQEGGTPRTLVELDAAELAVLTAYVAAVARGGYVTGQPGVTGASGSWLDLVGQNVYQLARNQAIATVGQVTLTDSANAGPFSISPGQIWVANTASLATSSPLRYLNTTGGTLPQGGTLTISVAAELPGSAYNVANSSITSLITNLPGVTVTNPAGGSGSWITTNGTDIESDLAYATRCMNKWPSVGIGATAATYDYWARTASAEVTRTKVAPNGTTGGQVDVWVAGASGAVSGGALTAVQNYLAPRLPVGTTQNTVNATNLTITIAGTAYVYAANVAAATAAIAANLLALIQAAPIGGTLYLSAVNDAIQKVTGVRNVASLTVNGAGSDLSLTAAQVAAALTNSLTITSI